MNTKQTKAWIKQQTNPIHKIVLWLSIFNFVMSLTAVFFAFYSKETIDTAVNQNKDAFMISAILLGSILFIQILASTISQFLRARAFGYGSKHLKSKLFNHLVYAKLIHTSSYHSGQLMNFVNKDAETVIEGYVDIKPKMIFYLSRFVAAFALLIWIDLIFALLFSGFGLILFLSSRVISKPIKKRHHDLMDKEAQANSYMQENLENVTVIKSFEAEKEIGQTMNRKLDSFFKSYLKKNRLTVFSSSGMQLFFATGYGFAIIFGAFRLMEGALTFGSLTALIQLVGHIQSPFSGLSQIVPKHHSMIASAERLTHLFSFEIEHKTPHQKIQLFDRIDIKNLYFAYDQKPIISNLTASIKPKEFIRITGDSGKGKTTFMKLLLGLLEPSKGMMYFVNKQQKHIISPETRHAFAYVPQGNYILSGTIRENLELFKKVSDDTLKWACHVACILEDIEALEHGFDTVLKERGQGFSEGQIQRLAIARALLKDAPILLLDEITSALDSKTESKVLSQIKEMTDKTCIIVSHRPLSSDYIDREIIIPELS